MPKVAHLGAPAILTLFLKREKKKNTIRAWDKGPTAEVESSHGRFNPTKSRVKVDFLTKVEYSRVPDCDFDFQSQFLTKPYTTHISHKKF